MNKQAKLSPTAAPTLPLLDLEPETGERKRAEFKLLNTVHLNFFYFIYGCQVINTFKKKNLINYMLCDWFV